MRRSFTLVVAVAVVVVLGLSSPVLAQSKSKSKAKKNDAKVLKVGDEVTVHIIGDEAQGNPLLAKAGVVGKDFFVVPTNLMAQWPRTGYPIEQAKSQIDDENETEFRDAADAGDSVGIAKLVAADRAVKVPAGTKLIVLLRTTSKGVARSGLPMGTTGFCRGRIQEGPAKGKIVDIPVRNLR